MPQHFLAVAAEGPMALEKVLVKANFLFQFLNVGTVPFPGLLGSHSVPEALFSLVLNFGDLLAFGKIMGVFFLRREV